MTSSPRPKIVVQGTFFADLTCWTPRMPRWGETLPGSRFRLGPGGKGSNQAIAAARLGAEVVFVTKIGRDPFAALARDLYAADQIRTDFIYQSPDLPTGTATILVDDQKGENAIVIVPAAAAELSPAEMDAVAAEVGGAAVYLAQLELPLPVVLHGLRLAAARGVPAILNPAPALALPPEIYPLVDYLTPNETEVAALSGRSVDSVADAGAAAEVLLGRGVKHVLVTLGEKGVLIADAAGRVHVPAYSAGPVVDTTGAGDAFNGALALALAQGKPLPEAARFGCAVAALSVTRLGAAAAMPQAGEVAAFLAKQPAGQRVRA